MSSAGNGIKPMHAGALRRRVTIQQVGTATPDGQGGAISKPWADVLTTWAQVDNLHGSELFAAMQVSAHQWIRVTLRYPPASVAVITSAMRLVDSGVTYNIRSVSDTLERHRTLVLMCEQVPGY